MQFSATVTTVTREAIMPKIFDTVLFGNVLLMRVLAHAKAWRSGIRQEFRIKNVKSTTGGIVPVGGTLDTSRQVTRAELEFEPNRRHKPVVIDDIEIAVNQGDEKVLELLATETESIAQDLKDDMGNDLYVGTGATGASFDSLEMAADDGKMRVCAVNKFSQMLENLVKSFVLMPNVA